MTRFKFQGTGETVGGSAAPVVALGVFLLLACGGTIATLAAAVWWVVFGIVVVVLAACVLLAVLLWPRLRPRAPERGEGPQYTPQLATIVNAERRELPAKTPPMIVNNFYGGEHIHAGQVPVIRQAITEEK